MFSDISSAHYSCQGLLRDNIYHQIWFWLIIHIKYINWIHHHNIHSKMNSCQWSLNWKVRLSVWNVFSECWNLIILDSKFTLSLLLLICCLVSNLVYMIVCVATSLSRSSLILLLSILDISMAICGLLLHLRHTEIELLLSFSLRKGFILSNIFINNKLPSNFQPLEPQETKDTTSNISFHHRNMIFSFSQRRT